MTENGRRGGPDAVVPLKDGDAFWLTDLYPDARALFEHEQVSIEVASSQCIVVLDANVLLLPFEFSSASVGEVERVYKELSAAKRLVVPGQAAREFYKNRSSKITAIADAIDAAITKAKKQIFDKSIPLLESDSDYLAARELGKDLVNKGKEVAERLEIVNARLKDEIGADRVSLLYRTLLGDCVSDLTIGSEDRGVISREVARRARLKIAPGYKDQQKEDGGIGDYLVWQSILQEGSKREVHCLFITEEEKPDWWIKRHGTFQPRPELIEEYRRASKGKSLHLLPLSGLLSVFKANEEVVQQVQALEERNRVNVEARVRRQLMAGVDFTAENRNDKLRILETEVAFAAERASYYRSRLAYLTRYAREQGDDDEDNKRKIASLRLNESSAAERLRNAERRLHRYRTQFTPNSDVNFFYQNKNQGNILSSADDSDDAAD